MQGAVEIGQALKDAPRPAADFELVGLDLSCAWDKLGLPPEAKSWSNPKIMQCLWDDYTERCPHPAIPSHIDFATLKGFNVTFDACCRMMVFSMGLHPRLGSSSGMQELNDECLRLVCTACWGN